MSGGRIGVRTLHRLFHDHGHTVAGWIRQRHLLRDHPRTVARIDKRQALITSHAPSCHGIVASRTSTTRCYRKEGDNEDE
jgi:hypothetical protein